MKNAQKRFRYRGRIHSTLFVGLITTLYAALVNSGPTATLWVGAGMQYSTIQHAIDAGTTGDAIQISPGVYNEHLTITKSILLQGENPETTIIDGSHSGRVIKVEAVQKVAIKNLQIRNGHLEANPEETAMGGGIWSTAPLKLENVRICNNTIQGGYPSTNRTGGNSLGGGVYTEAALYMQQCVFSSNESLAGGSDYSANITGAGGTAYGGAVCCVSAKCWAINCEYGANVCKGGLGIGEDGGSAFGGAICTESAQPYLSNCCFIGNQALLGGYFGTSDSRNGQGMGGAMAVVGGLLTGEGLSCLSNAASSGGALYLNSQAMLFDSVLAGNRGAQGSLGIYKGGAIYNDKYLMLKHCILENNSIDDGNGGALYNNGTVICSNCTFSANRAVGGHLTAYSFPMVTPLEGYGGALYNSGTCSLYHCHIESNKITGGSYYYGKSGFGGGISNTGTLLAISCTINGNNANGGGGVYLAGVGSAFGGGIFNSGITECQECTITANACWGPNGYNGGDAMGGGLYDNNQLILRQCTIQNNTVTGGEGGSYGPSHGAHGSALGPNIFRLNN